MSPPASIPVTINSSLTNNLSSTISSNLRSPSSSTINSSSSSSNPNTSSNRCRYRHSINSHSKFRCNTSRFQFRATRSRDNPIHSSSSSSIMGSPSRC